MNQKPFVLPLETPMGKYFYEVNRNEIVAVNDDLFECIKKALSSEDGNLLDIFPQIMCKRLSTRLQRVCRNYWTEGWRKSPYKLRRGVT